MPPVNLSIDPDDSIDLPRIALSVRATTAGTIAIVDLCGNTSTITVLAGVDNVQLIRAIRSTGTTAGGLTCKFYADQE